MKHLIFFAGFLLSLLNFALATNQDPANNFSPLGVALGKCYLDPHSEMNRIFIGEISPSEAGFFCCSFFDPTYGPLAMRFAHKELLQNLKKIYLEQGYWHVAIKDSFLETDRAFCAHTEEDFSGTNATLVGIIGRLMTVANVGNAKAILIKQNSFVEITTDHTLNNKTEAIRVYNSGAATCANNLIASFAEDETNGNDADDNHVARILSTTRSIGNKNFKEPSLLGKARLERFEQVADGKPIVSATPDINNILLAGDELLVVIASAGFWQLRQPLETAQYCQHHMEGLTIKNRAEGSTEAQSLAIGLMNYAHARLTESSNRQVGIGVLLFIKGVPQ